MLFYCNPLHIPDLHKKLKAIYWTEKGQIAVTQQKSQLQRDREYSVPEVRVKVKESLS